MVVVDGGGGELKRSDVGREHADIHAAAAAAAAAADPHAARVQTQCVGARVRGLRMLSRDDDDVC